MNTSEIICGKCEEIMKSFQENAFHCCVTDPPYNISLLNQSWDSSGIAYSIPMWQEVYRVLMPGAFCLVFSGRRTGHRVACAIEDAGFIIKNSITWCYMNGKPSARYGLKPATEPIIVAQKPLSESNINKNVMRWGTGAMCIDECKIQGEKWPSTLMIDEEIALRLEEKSKLFFVARASSKERDMGLDDFEEKIAGCYHGRQDGSLDGHITRLKNNHATVKPITLMKELIKLVSKEGQTVLDPFSGSFSTGVAALSLNRNFIGIEENEDYCKIGSARINAVISQ